MNKKSILIFFAILTVISGLLLIINIRSYILCRNSYDEVRSKVESTSSINFNELKAINDDVIGWIKIKGTKIDYPIVKAENNEEYLSKLFDKRPGFSGSIFADCRYGSFDSFLTILYGHRMRDGTMFNNLKFFKDKAWANKHQQIKIFTDSNDFDLKIVSFSLVDATDNVYAYKGFDDSDKERFIESLKKNALYNMSDASASDKLVILSTCTYEYDNARYILVGKLIWRG